MTRAVNIDTLIAAVKNPQRAVRQFLISRAQVFTRPGRSVSPSAGQVPVPSAAERAEEGANAGPLAAAPGAAGNTPAPPAAAPGDTGRSHGVARRRPAEPDADRRVTLEPLTGGDVVLLLTHLIGEERASREPEATRQFVGLCDGLPLALRIAGSRLQNRHTWTMEHLVGRMAGDERRLGELSIGNRSVEPAFRLSYDQLAPDRQGADSVPWARRRRSSSTY